MAHYYVNTNAQWNGDHEVHKQGCVYMPAAPIALGNFTNCREAVNQAKNFYAQVNGCAYCSPECHTQ